MPRSEIITCDSCKEVIESGHVGIILSLFTEMGERQSYFHDHRCFGRWVRASHWAKPEMEVNVER